MQLTLCPLFSGSSGNSVYVACGGVKLLVDAGGSATRKPICAKSVWIFGKSTRFL